MRLMLLAALLLTLGLAGCQACPSSTPYGAAPGATDIFGNPCGKPVYEVPACPGDGPLGAVNDFFSDLHDDIFGCTKPAPAPNQVVAAVPPPAAAPSQWGPCGEPPANAKPGENWCCVLVQPAAAAPLQVDVCVPVAAVYGTEEFQVLVAPARTEWRRIDCASAGPDSECWQLVEVPAVYETRTRQVVVAPASVRHETKLVPQAAPPPFWEWRKVDDCSPPPAAGLGAPPAGDCD